MGIQGKSPLHVWAARSLLFQGSGHILHGCFEMQEGGRTWEVHVGGEVHHPLLAVAGNQNQPTLESTSVPQSRTPNVGQQRVAPKQAWPTKWKARSEEVRLEVC